MFIIDNLLRGHFELFEFNVQMVLKSKEDDDDLEKFVQNKFLQVLLGYSVYHKNWRLFKFLLDRIGVDVNSQGYKYKTPL